MNTTSSSPITANHVGAIFFQRAAELGDRTFIKVQQGECFKDISWRDFGSLVEKALLGLIALGLAPGDTIAICGENCVEWLAADLATLASGMTNVVIAPTLSDLMLLKVLGHSACRAAFVHNAAGVGRLLNLKGQLPALAHIITMEEGQVDVPGVLTFGKLLDRGRNVDKDRLPEILQAVHPNSLASIMYTSGSTGEPKGVMRTQENLLANITNGGAIVVSSAEELTVNVLSLNHLFGRFGILKSAVTGRTTALVEAAESRVNLAIIEKLAPTGLAVVPRVMERFWETILKDDGNRELWQELEMLDQRKQTGAALYDREASRFDVLRIELKANVRRALGGRIKYIAYGGAAMPPRIMRFFELIGIPLIGSYGSTECGGVTLCGIGENHPGNLGKPFANVEIRIAADGEILVRGPTVSPGYFKNPEATREAFDEDGWFRTGDLGVIESDGSLRIIGRKKDVFNCSDGSNIYPGFIELQLENEPFIRQAVLIGDRRPYIAALIVPRRRKIATALQREIADLTASEIEAAVWTQIGRVSSRLESYEQIRKLAVMNRPFPRDVRSINQFQKVKVDRKAVAERYRAEIDAIYAAAAVGGLL
jgi:long-chain acyl-CoA synthetase